MSAKIIFVPTARPKQCLVEVLALPCLRFLIGVVSRFCLFFTAPFLFRFLPLASNKKKKQPFFKKGQKPLEANPFEETRRFFKNRRMNTLSKAIPHSPSATRGCCAIRGTTGVSLILRAAKQPFGTKKQSQETKM